MSVSNKQQCSRCPPGDAGRDVPLEMFDENGQPLCNFCGDDAQESGERVLVERPDPVMERANAATDFSFTLEIDCSNCGDNGLPVQGCGHLGEPICTKCMEEETDLANLRGKKEEKKREAIRLADLEAEKMGKPRTVTATYVAAFFF